VSETSWSLELDRPVLRIAKLDRPVRIAKLDRPVLRTAELDRPVRKTSWLLGWTGR
jgi:hypothetical protein